MLEKVIIIKNRIFLGKLHYNFLISLSNIPSLYKSWWLKDYILTILINWLNSLIKIAKYFDYNYYDKEIKLVS